MFVRLALVVLLSAASASATGLPLACTNVTSGYLAYKVCGSAFNTIEAIVTCPARDAGGHQYLHGDHSRPLQLFTLQTCNSTFLGFSPNDTSATYGRWMSKGKCITAERSDGALVMKPCAKTDGGALLRQYFSVSGSMTQLVGGTAENNTLMYTFWSTHQGYTIPTQQAAKPPGWCYGRSCYRRYLMWYPLPSTPPVKWFG